MKHTRNRITSLLLAASMIFCSSAVNAFSADTEKEKVFHTITFDLDGDDGITIEEDAKLEKTITVEAESSLFLPKTKLEKDKLKFSGWTPDGIIAYEPGDVIWVHDEDITLKPIFYDKYSEDIYEINYIIELDGEELDIDPKKIPNDTLIPGQIHKLSNFSAPSGEYNHTGWTYEGIYLRGEQKIVMPDHDIDIYAKWFKYRKLTYYAGDDERVTGATMMEYEFAECFDLDLQAANRFSMKGFRITGWLCENDGKIYAPLSSFTMPMEDVNMYAVWEPIEYVVVFNANTGNANDNVKVKGKTDTNIIVPECTAKKDGYVFSGWKASDKKIYQPGDEYFIEGVLSGLGISLTAVWTKEPTTTEPTTNDKNIKGDANCDGKVTIADAVFIMQSQALPGKYIMTQQGAINADVDETGNGVTNKDALKIQRYLLGLEAL